MNDNLSFDNHVDALKLVNKTLDIFKDTRNPKVVVEALAILTGAAILTSGNHEYNLEQFVKSVRKIIAKHKK